MMKSAVMAGLALVLLSGTPAEAARKSCAATVAERLDRLNVDRADVRGVYYDVQRRTSGDNERVVGVLAWVRLRSCRGYLVIDMSRHCTVRQVYGRGACDLGGAVETW
ncbi:MAG: hypothetical protein ACE5KF_09400 [Kiloniellaceae bacterium]